MLVARIKHQSCTTFPNGKPNCANVNRNCYIPKSNGGQHPLGILTPHGKRPVVQMMVLLELRPVFEADFHPRSYGFRPGRNAHQALDEIVSALRRSSSYAHWDKGQALRQRRACWLKARGLQLNEEKTRVVAAVGGLTFLGSGCAGSSRA